MVLKLVKEAGLRVVKSNMEGKADWESNNTYYERDLLLVVERRDRK